ncbi:MAG: hypothetical protein ACPGRE_04990 [Flavobacteriaceae bacterium]
MKDQNTFTIRYKGHTKKHLLRSISPIVSLLVIYVLGLQFSLPEPLNSNVFWWGFIASMVSLTILQTWMYLKGYAIVQGNSVKRKSLFHKEIDLTTIDSIRKFAGDYKFQSNGKTLLVLNYTACEDSDIEKLNDLIREYKIEWK